MIFCTDYVHIHSKNGDRQKYMHKIIRRRFEYADVSQVNHLFFKIFGKQRTEKQFIWEFLEIPGGPASIWVLEDKGKSKIIGNYSLIPIPFSYFGRPISSGKTESTMLDPEYRKKGIYTPFEMDCISQAKDLFQLIWVSYTGALKTHEKAGYKPVGILTHYIKVLKRDRLVKVLSAAPNIMHSNRVIKFFAIFIANVLIQIVLLRCGKRNILDEVVDLKKIENIDSISQDLGKIWKSAKRYYGISINRDIHFLKWRIVNNPYINYDFFGVLKHNKLIGYIILRKNEIKGVKIGTVVDLFIGDNDEAIFHAILAKVVNMFRETDVDLIDFPTLLSKNFINRILRKSGFISTARLRCLIDGKRPLLLVNSLSDKMHLDKVFDCNSWYFTEMFTEGVK